MQCPGGIGQDHQSRCAAEGIIQHNLNAFWCFSENHMPTADVHSQVLKMLAEQSCQAFSNLPCPLRRTSDFASLFCGSHASLTQGEGMDAAVAPSDCIGFLLGILLWNCAWVLFCVVTCCGGIAYRIILVPLLTPTNCKSWACLVRTMRTALANTPGTEGFRSGRSDLADRKKLFEETSWNLNTTRHSGLIVASCGFWKTVEEAT